MARSLTVHHQESPSALFAVLMIVCALLLMLGGVFGASSTTETPVEPPVVQASAH